MSNTILLFTKPTYLDVLVAGQDTPARRPLESKTNITSLRGKLTLRVGLVRRLAKSSWVAVKKKILRTATFSKCSLYY